MAPIGSPRCATDINPKRHEVNVLIAFVATALLVATLVHSPAAASAPSGGLGGCP